MNRKAGDATMMQPEQFSEALPAALYRAAFEQATAAMGMLGMDGRWLAANPALCALLGYPESRLLALGWSDVVDGGDDGDGADGAALARIRAELEGGAPFHARRRRCLRRDGAALELMVRVTLARPAGAGACFIVQLLELPRTLVEEEEGRRQREKIRLLVNNVSDAFIGTDEDGIITEWNGQAEQILQWRADEAIGRDMVPMLVPERLRALHSAGFQRFVRSGVPTIIDKPVEVPLLRKDGTEIHAEMTIGAARHLGRYYFATFVRDISQRKDLERQLQRQATHDHLTGLPNRFEFMRRLEQHIAAAEHGGADGELALLFIDLDGFKQVNDLYGHHEGDRVLAGFAAALLGCIRHGDVAGRLSGDEFVVLASGLDHAGKDAAAVANKILAAARAVSDAGAPVSASIGIAVRAQGATASGLVRQGDAAMYAAKQAGKNRYAFHPGSAAPPARGGAGGVSR